jgi:hypothetical protein
VVRAAGHYRAANSAGSPFTQQQPPRSSTRQAWQTVFETDVKLAIPMGRSGNALSNLRRKSIAAVFAFSVIVVRI